MIVQFNIMHSMNLSYLNFEENFLVFFSISLPNFLIFLVVSALMFLFRFSLFMSRWLSANWCFCAFLLLSSFWFIWFFCQCPSEPSLASLPFLSLQSLNSDSWTIAIVLQYIGESRREIQTSPVCPVKWCWASFVWINKFFLVSLTSSRLPWRKIEISIDFHLAAKW